MDRYIIVALCLVLQYMICITLQRNKNIHVLYTVHLLYIFIKYGIVFEDLMEKFIVNIFSCGQTI